MKLIGKTLRIFEKQSSSKIHRPIGDHSWFWGFFSGWIEKNEVTNKESGWRILNLYKVNEVYTTHIRKLSWKDWPCCWLILAKQGWKYKCLSLKEAENPSTFELFGQNAPASRFLQNYQSFDSVALSLLTNMLRTVCVPSMLRNDLGWFVKCEGATKLQSWLRSCGCIVSKAHR